MFLNLNRRGLLFLFQQYKRVAKPETFVSKSSSLIG